MKPQYITPSLIKRFLLAFLFSNPFNTYADFLDIQPQVTIGRNEWALGGTFFLPSGKGFSPYLPTQFDPFSHLPSQTWYEIETKFETTSLLARTSIGLGHRLLSPTKGFVGGYLFLDGYWLNVSSDYFNAQQATCIACRFGGCSQPSHDKNVVYPVANIGCEWATPFFYANCNYYIRFFYGPYRVCLSQSLSGVTDWFNSRGEWQLLNGFDINFSPGVRMPTALLSRIEPFAGIFYHPISLKDRSILNPDYQFSFTPYNPQQKGAFTGIVVGANYRWRFAKFTIKATLDNVGCGGLNMSVQLNPHAIVYGRSVAFAYEPSPADVSPHLRPRYYFSRSPIRHIAPTYDWVNTLPYVSEKITGKLSQYVMKTIRDPDVKFLNEIAERLDFNYRYLRGGISVGKVLNINSFRSIAENRVTSKLNDNEWEVALKEHMVTQMWMRLSKPSRAVYFGLVSSQHGMPSALFIKKDTKALESDKFADLIKRTHALPYELKRQIIAYALAEEPIFYYHKQKLDSTTTYYYLLDSISTYYYLNASIHDHKFMLTCVDFLVNQLTDLSEEQALNFTSWGEYLRTGLIEYKDYEARKLKQK